MQLNVAQQLKEPIGSTRNYTVNGTVDIAEGSSQVQGEVKLIRTDRGILAEGTLKTEIERTCSRCLNPFTCSLTLNIEEEYLPTTDVSSGESLSLTAEPGIFTIDAHNILDLTEAIRQYALMNIPIKPLCRDDCAGLCPTCGHNLNQSPCNCPPVPADPRWYKLTKPATADSRTPVNGQKGMK